MYCVPRIPRVRLNCLAHICIIKPHLDVMLLYWLVFYFVSNWGYF